MVVGGTDIMLLKLTQNQSLPHSLEQLLPILMLFDITSCLDRTMVLFVPLLELGNVWVSWHACIFLLFSDTISAH
jgi:hypothetical protein